MTAPRHKKDKTTIYRIPTMKKALLLSLMAGMAHAQAPAPLPLLVDSERATVAAIEVFQANVITIRASYKSGNTANTIATETPFLYWLPFGATNSTVVTARWDIVTSNPAVVDFTFLPADLNYAPGTYAYQVGLDVDDGPTVVKQGSLVIKASAASIGADPIAFASTNVNWGLINWTGLPAYEYQTNTIAISNAINARLVVVETGHVTRTTFAATNTGLQVEIGTKLPTTTHAASTQAIWAAVDTKLPAATHVSSTSAIWAAIDTKLPTATHAASTAEIWSAIGGIVSADNALTNVTGDARITATVTAGQAALAFDATGLATGAPLYAVSFAGLATGTPLYVETDPIWSSASNDYATVSSLSAFATGSPLYEVSFAGLATGTPLYVETGTGTLVAASIASFMPGAAISNEFYPASNPSGYVSSAIASNSYLALSGGTLTGPLDMQDNNINNVVAIGGIGGSINLEESTINAGTYAFTFDHQPIIPGYLTTNGNASGLTNFPATLATEAKLASSSNTLFAQTLAIGAGATSLTLQAWATGSNALIAANGVGLAATNLHLAQGVILTGAVNGVVAVGLVATNAAAGVVVVGAVASNAYPIAGFATGVAALVNSTETTNFNFVLQAAKTNLNMGGHSITNWRALTGEIINSTAGSNTPAYSIWFNSSDNGYPYFTRSSRGTQGAFLGTWNFSSSSYRLQSEHTAYATNAIRLFYGAVTQNQINAQNQIWISTTNMWLPDAPYPSTNWIKFEGRANVH
jgi:hypothetical protein